MNTEKELTYGIMMKKLMEIAQRSEIVRLSYIGNTINSRPIPLITMGEQSAEKSVLYVATHHATESICTSVLIKFIEEYEKAYERQEKACGISIRVLNKMRKIYIVPMLNPDGVEYRTNGIDELNPLYERVMKMSNGGDFEGWNANARGVDLNHNYDARFWEYKQIENEQKITQGPTKYSGESPESEPEVSALASFIRYNSDELQGIITLHTQGEEIYYKSNGKCLKRSEYLIRMLAKMTSYKPSDTQGTASYGGLSDWYIKEFDKPSFTFECGKGKNPLPVSQIPRIYMSVREALFTFPILF